MSHAPLCEHQAIVDYSCALKRVAHHMPLDERLLEHGELALSSIRTYNCMWRCRWCGSARTGTRRCCVSCAPGWPSATWWRSTTAPPSPPPPSLRTRLTSSRRLSPPSASASASVSTTRQHSPRQHSVLSIDISRSIWIKSRLGLNSTFYFINFIHAGVADCGSLEILFICSRQ